MARSFFITRASITSEDPTALEFFPPKGSDELHEALKEAFPFEANLAARMRAAVIEFLLQEQQADQFTPISPEYLPSPQSSFVSTLPSPAMTSSRTSQSRRQSTAAGQPTQEALMDVWSLPNKPQAKVHTRRTMTAEEKKAYKQKRLVGACADCKRRRRKCDHNSAAAGTSPVPQKVGKHKKRASAAIAPTSISKPSIAEELSWAAPAFNFDNDFSSMVMPEMESFDTSFEFDTTELNFAPDLNTDWQLFPDLPIANTNTFAGMSPTWSSDHNSAYDPRGGLSPLRVTMDFGSEERFLSQNIQNQSLLSSGLADTGLYGNATFANAPISPATPESLSPISRTQSNGSLYDGAANTSAGANIDQSRVSRGNQLQASMSTALSPSPTSPTSPSQSRNDIPSSELSDGVGRMLSAAPNIDTPKDLNPVVPGSTTTCRWAHLIKSTGENSQPVNVKARATAGDNHFQQGEPRGVNDVFRHKQEHQFSQDPSHQHGAQDHNEAAFLIQDLLQISSTLQSRTTRSSLSSPPSSTPSTTSRPTMSRAISASSVSLRTTGDSQAPGRKEDDISREVKKGMLPTERQKEMPRLDLTTDGSIAGSWPNGQAPLCVALFAAYCAMKQSSNAFAIAASQLLGLLLVLASLVSVQGTTKLPSMLASQALRSVSRLGGLATRSQRSSTEAIHHQSNTSVLLKQSPMSRLAFPLGTVMV